MIIKKKYVDIKIKNDNKADNESSLDSNVVEEKEEIQEVRENISNIEEATPKKEMDLSFSVDDITFEPRQERREGTRRRGYRRTQDRNIVSRAQQDAESIKETAKQEGYKDGINNAQKDIELLKSALNEFYNYKDYVFEKVSECILDISVEIAKKIINKEIETDKNSLISIIKNAVEEVNKTENKITLKVMPKDVEIVKDSLPEIFTNEAVEAKITVIPDNSIKEGGVIVETSNGIIDAAIESQLEIMKQALKGQSEKG